MQNLAIGGQRNGAGPVDGLLDFVASNFARTRAQADAAVAVDAAHVRLRRCRRWRARPARRRCLRRLRPLSESPPPPCRVRRSRPCASRAIRPRRGRDSAGRCRSNSAISAQVLALPTSIAVRKFPCWFAIAYEFLDIDQIQSSELVIALDCFAIAGLRFRQSPGSASESPDAPAADGCRLLSASGFAADCRRCRRRRPFSDADALCHFAVVALGLGSCSGAAFFAAARLRIELLLGQLKRRLGKRRRSCGLMRVISAAGFTPAAAAALAAEARQRGLLAASLPYQDSRSPGCRSAGSPTPASGIAAATPARG